MGECKGKARSRDAHCSGDFYSSFDLLFDSLCYESRYRYFFFMILSLCNIGS